MKINTIKTEKEPNKTTCYYCGEICLCYDFIEVYRSGSIRHLEDYIQYDSGSYCPVCRDCASHLKASGYYVGHLSWIT